MIFSDTIYFAFIKFGLKIRSKAYLKPKLPS